MNTSPDVYFYVRNLKRIISAAKSFVSAPQVISVSFLSFAAQNENLTMNNNYCVIMGGGIGSRFWPFSRENRPKQFLDFFGTGRSLLQMTVDRFAKIIPKENI